MQTAGPTPLRYFDTPKPRPRDRLNFRRPKRKELRVWPFFLAVLAAAGAIFAVIVALGAGAPGPADAGRADAAAMSHAPAEAGNGG
ncbi:MAG: hypothetical protein ACKVPY_00315 [Paracoccaceae bacterium]